MGALSRVRAAYPLLAVDPEVASCFARLASAEPARGRRLRHHDTWIAATALRHDAAVVTQDADASGCSGRIATIGCSPVGASVRPTPTQDDRNRA